jgi:hypothetical protein
MTAIELARLVTEMRDAQKKYFRDRGQGDLEASKRLEREVDRAAKEILSGDVLALFR